MTLNWDHLRFFLALARTGTLPAAGQREGVSHTTVFRRVRRFEEELQTKLFDRTPSGWTLTPAGVRVLLEAERMENSVQTVAQDLAGRDGQVAGPVTVAVDEGVALAALSNVVQRVLKEHPRLQLALRVGRGLVDLQQRDADLAVRFSDAPPEWLLGRRLGVSGLVPCAAPSYVEARGVDHPSTPNGHRFIVVKAFKPPYWSKLRLDAHPESVLFVDCFVTAAELCRAGIGITEVPDYVVDADPKLVRLRDGPRRPTLSAWLLMHPDLSEVARVRVTADALYDGLRPLFDPATGSATKRA